MEEKRKADESKIIHVPSWGNSGFIVYGNIKLPQMKSKILEFNSQLADGKMDATELKTFERLCVNIGDSANYHAAPFSEDERKLVVKLLQWPTDKIFPILDAVRQLMCHSAGIKALGSDQKVQERLFEHAKGGATQLNLVLKILSNWVAKRDRASSERDNPPKIPSDVSTFLVEALDRMAEAAASDDDKVLNAYIMFTHNLICWYGRLKIPESEFYAMVASGILGMFEKEQKEEVLFHALLTLGSMALASASAKDMIKETFGDQVQALIKKTLSLQNKKMVEIGQDCKRVFGF
jgi:hypothetical protein